MGSRVGRSWRPRGIQRWKVGPEAKWRPKGRPAVCHRLDSVGGSRQVPAGAHRGPRCPRRGTGAGL